MLYLSSHTFSVTCINLFHILNFLCSVNNFFSLSFPLKSVSPWFCISISRFSPLIFVGDNRSHVIYLYFKNKSISINLRIYPLLQFSGYYHPVSPLIFWLYFLWFKLLISYDLRWANVMRKCDSLSSINIYNYICL